MAGRLAEKVSIITGASSGIGYATAVRFAEEGAILSICARRVERLEALKKELEEKYNTKVLVTKCDVTVYEDIVNVVEQTVKTFGRIDVLVNNAGMIDYHVPITRCSHEWWDKLILTNQTSIFHFTQEVLKYMEPAGYGSIINTSSLAGYRGNCGYPYSTAKAAVIAMTKNVALQYNMTQIRCNAICPGRTPTEIENEIDKFDAEFQEHCFKGMNMDVPQCDPVDQANAILYFASDEAKSTTGQVLVIDHGQAL